MYTTLSLLPLFIYPVLYFTRNTKTFPVFLFYKQAETKTDVNKSQ